MNKFRKGKSIMQTLTVPLCMFNECLSGRMKAGAYAPEL